MREWAAHSRGIKQIVLFLLFMSLAVTHASETSVDPYANETQQQRDERMKWFRDAKFGLFIHWGVYAVPAGTYNGAQIGGIGEWIMNNGQIPMAEYQSYAKEFNPVKYDPDAWVRLAKEAGMKYIVITSKHHDGFALFDSKVSKWDVVDATPYGKDLIKPLAEACKKHGIRLGLYYSQAQDWNQGGSARKKWDPAQEHSMDDYIKDIAVPQVREILSNYGPIAILWWDTPVDMNAARAEQLIPLLKLQPGIIHNNRLGGGYKGDTITPEQHIPGTGLPGDWESCMTMNNTWGYKSYDHNWKSTETLVRNLVDIASKGGNYLLNVGPTAEGLIPEASVERLKEIGRWMKLYGAAVYNTTASPCARPTWGRITKRIQDGGTTMYLNVFEWPAAGTLFVPVSNKVETCYLLGDEARKFKTSNNEDGITVQLTGAASDPICSVVVLKISGEPVITPANIIRQEKDGSVSLPSAKAIINNTFGSHIGYDPALNCISAWTSSGVSVEWSFAVRTPGAFAVKAVAATEKQSEFTVSIGKNNIIANIPSTGGYGSFNTIDLGSLSVEKAGEYTLKVSPGKKAWNPVNLREVTLTPIKKEE